MVNLLSSLKQNTAEYFNQVLELSGFNLCNHVLCIKWFSTLSVKIQNCSLGHEWVLRITSTVLLLFSPSSSPLLSCGSFFSWTCLFIFSACLWVFSILSLSLLKFFCKLVVPIYIPMSNINSSITPQPHQYFDIMNVFNFKCYNGACRDFVCVCGFTDD